MGTGYVHGYADEEQQRLIDQAAHWRDDLILDGTMLEPGTRLLEIGCGVGAVLAELGRAFPGVQLHGVDIEPRRIETARVRLGPAAELRVADASDLSYPDASFDHVWMMWFIEHLGDPLPALREARRVLKPGGELTAIETDYNTVWTEPADPAITFLFSGLADAMERSGHSDAGTRLSRWLIDAGFHGVDPGERQLHFTGAELRRQIDYAADVTASTIPALKVLNPSSAGQLDLGLARVRALPDVPAAAFGWTVYKARAVR
ncbi:MAG: class I SAM-dependent methyltransferase [Solirubrobacterales bacterium]|nr:class I SAM-dependent methyltransferase [Solirubrobacterales bacterium]